jgi:uncharacterized protein
MRKVGALMSAIEPTRAANVVMMLRDGRFDELERLFAPELAAVVSADTVRTGWNSEIAKIGEVRAVGEPTVTPLGERLTRAVIPVHGSNGGIEIRLSMDPDGLLHGLRITQPSESAWRPPAYANQRRFTEHDIVLESGPLTVPGTLTLPRSAHGAPAVVLLASGASDRDVTVGPKNKPFKDLAWGMASRGVAVVRFDKITHVDTRIASEPGFTMVDEYLPNALAAVRLLQQRPEVDPARVFVAGISGGGKATVRVAAADPSIAGIVMLAADAVPLPRAAARIIDYVAGIEPAAGGSDTVHGAAEAIARTEDPALSPETPSTELLFGWPASYWLDLREFDQVTTAAALNRPILILQGGRDYQVTETEDLAAWRAGLHGGPGVSIKVFPDDDHMFFRGSGPSAPSDYQVENHVDPAVVDAIVKWMGPARRRGGLRRLLPGRGRRSL